MMPLMHNIDNNCMRTDVFVFIRLSMYVYLRFVLLTCIRKDEAHEKLLIIIKSIIPHIFGNRYELQHSYTVALSSFLYVGYQDNMRSCSHHL